MNAEIKAQLLSIASADIDKALLHKATRTTATTYDLVET
jgi:hypothetical protein